MLKPLEVRRIIKATPERLFEAWTTPEQLLKWWGPRPVRCVDAEVDLRVGGNYRIANLLPDGKILWITGEFEVINPPHLLVYSWQGSERVTVRFEPREGGTEVIVIHERIPDDPTRERHEYGWLGCLEGLVAYLGIVAESV